jgi:hypothetical protein
VTILLDAFGVLGLFILIGVIFSTIGKGLMVILELLDELTGAGSLRWIIDKDIRYQGEPYRVVDVHAINNKFKLRSREFELIRVKIPLGVDIWTWEDEVSWQELNRDNPRYREFFQTINRKES